MRTILLASLLVALFSVASAQQKIYMQVTSYGWDDNSPPSADIAYPNSSYNTQHSEATSAPGYYNDAVTMATSSSEIPIGTIVYIPFLKKYFVMEDDCVQCDSDWNNGNQYHIDLWMGPDYWSDQNALDNCEGYITRSSTLVIVNPPNNLDVDTTPFFWNNQCTAHVYDQ